MRVAGGIAAEPDTVHIDVPRWFGTNQPVPHLPALADAVRLKRRVTLTYNRKRRHGAAPLGLVNKAGVWYAVVTGTASPFVVHVARIQALATLADTFERPEDFDLVDFWHDWSAECEHTRPRLDVVVRASPDAVEAMPEVFGQRILPAIATAAVDKAGWLAIPLSFEHEAAAVARLAGFADQIKVLSPDSVRTRLAQPRGRSSLRTTAPYSRLPPNAAVGDTDALLQFRFQFRALGALETVEPVDGRVAGQSDSMEMMRPMDTLRI